MSKNSNCLFILSESPWLVWMHKFLKDIQENILLATYDFRSGSDRRVTLRGTSLKKLIDKVAFLKDKLTLPPLRIRVKRSQ